MQPTIAERHATRSNNPPPHFLKNNNIKNVINPAENDIPDDKLNDIANDYMEKMGMSDLPYLVVKHTDIDKIHLHIVTTNARMDGKRININNEFNKSGKIRRELEKKYNLQPAEEENMSLQEKLAKKVATFNEFVETAKIPKEITFGERDLTLNMRRILRYVRNN